MKFCVPYRKGCAVTTPYRTTSPRATASASACDSHEVSVGHELHGGLQSYGRVFPDPELDVFTLETLIGKCLEGLEVTISYRRLDLIVPSEGLFFFCRFRHRGFAFFQASS